MIVLCTHAAPTAPLNFVLETVVGFPTQLRASWSTPDPANGVITEYTLRCTSDTQPPESFTNLISGNVSSFMLDNLRPYTTYSCNVSATTGDGEGPATEVMTAQTDEAGL